MVDRTGGLTPAERKTARERILRRAKELGVDTSEWQKVKASFEAIELRIEAFSGHPNKIPFTGVLTRIDEPSDNPLGGTNGKRVIIPRAVAEKALHTLIDMAVDFRDDLSGHDPQQKIGLIKEAWIEGNAIHISGFFYGTDFPDEVKAIQAAKEKLGFSYEAQALVRSLDEDPLVVEHCVFTGAAILYKDKAAYESTSLVAQKDGDGTDDEVSDMDAKEIQAALEKLTGAVDGINKRIDDAEKKAIAAAADPTKLSAASLHHMVQPHAAAMRTCAAAMVKDGIGAHPTQGHGAVMNKMADHLEAASFSGQLPHICRDHDYFGASADKSLTAAAEEAAKKASDAAAKETTALKASVADLTTMVKDLKAQAFEAAGTKVERKTLSKGVFAALQRAGIKTPGDDGALLNVADVDAAFDKVQGLQTFQKMAAKMELRAAGLMN